MKKFLALLVGVVASSSVWAMSSGRSYEYRIRIPASDRSCVEEAGLLGERFQKATAIQPDSSECRGEVMLSADGRQYKLYSLLVKYTADVVREPYSAIYGEVDMFGRTSDFRGNYAR